MASRESTQKKLGRIRPPRVHITYDVETGGAIEKRELPFVVGVFADLSGLPDKPLPKYKDRKFIEIDRDNVDQVMAKQTPRIAYKVNNTLKNDESKLGIELRFKKMADFEPQNVVQQVDPLRQLMELRQKLSNLRSSLYGNDKLEELLQEAVRNTEALQGLSSEKGPADSESGQSKKE